MVKKGPWKNGSNKKKKKKPSTAIAGKETFKVEFHPEKGGEKEATAQGGNCGT